MQFNALPGALTGREVLHMYARLRGVPSPEVRSAVEDLIERIDLSEYADRCCRPPHFDSASNSQSLQRLCEDTAADASAHGVHSSSGAVHPCGWSGIQHHCFLQLPCLQEIDTRLLEVVVLIVC